MENVKKKTTTLAKTFSLLFDEKFKALVLVAYQLHKHGVCSFNEIFEGSGLKQMGASTGTVTRALKALEAAGIVQKEKAPFPVKARYRLTQRMPEIQLLVELIGKILAANETYPLEPERYQELLQEWPKIADFALLLTLKYLNEGDSAQTALIGFILLDFMYHLAANMPSDVQAAQLGKLDAMVQKQLYERTILEKVLQAKV